jgi:DNA polymerase III subunit beta
MNFKCKTKELLQAILKVETATSKSIPILENILLELKDNVLSITATNTEILLKTTIQCESGVNGKILLPTKKVIDILKELKTDDISFILKESKLKIKSGKSNFVLNILEADDYCIVENFNTDNSHLIINLDKLQQCLNLTAFATSIDQTRFVLTGVLLEVNNSKMRLFATDGKRLSFVESENVANNIDLKVILPKKLTTEILKLKGDNDSDTICFYITNNKIFIKFKDMEIVSNLIDGEFPNCNNLIPKDCKYKIKINTTDLLETTKRMSVLNPKDKNYPTIYSFSNNKLTIKANIPNIGETLEEIDINYTNEEIKTAYNPDFLTDCLKRVECDDLIFNISTAQNPAMIEIVSDINFKYILMPMRV